MSIGTLLLSLALALLAFNMGYSKPGGKTPSTGCSSEYPFDPAYPICTISNDGDKGTWVQIPEHLRSSPESVVACYNVPKNLVNPNRRVKNHVPNTNKECDCEDDEQKTESKSSKDKNAESPSSKLSNDRNDPECSNTDQSPAKKSAPKRKSAGKKDDQDCDSDKAIKPKSKNNNQDNDESCEPVTKKPRTTKKKTGGNSRTSSKPKKRQTPKSSSPPKSKSPKNGQFCKCQNGKIYKDKNGDVHAEILGEPVNGRCVCNICLKKQEDASTCVE